MGTGPVSHHLFTFIWNVGITICHQPGGTGQSDPFFLAFIFAVFCGTVGAGSSSLKTYLREAAPVPPKGNGDRSRFPPLIYISMECRDHYLSPTWGNRPIKSVFLALIFAGFCGTVGTGSSSLNNHLREAAPVPPVPVVHRLSAIISHSYSLAAVHFTICLLSNFLRSDFPFFTLAFEIGQVPVCILAIAKRFRSSLFGESRVAK